MVEKYNLIRFLIFLSQEAEPLLRRMCIQYVFLKLSAKSKLIFVIIKAYDIYFLILVQNSHICTSFKANNALFSPTTTLLATT